MLLRMQTRQSTILIYLSPLFVCEINLSFYPSPVSLTLSILLLRRPPVLVKDFWPSLHSSEMIDSLSHCIRFRDANKHREAKRIELLLTAN